MLYVGLPRSLSRLIKQFEKSTPLTVFELGNFELGPSFGTRPQKRAQMCLCFCLSYNFDPLRNGIRRCNFGILLIALEVASGHFPFTTYVRLTRSPSRLIQQFEKSTPLTVFELGFSNFHNILILLCPKN